MQALRRLSVVAPRVAHAPLGQVLRRSTSAETQPLTATTDAAVVDNNRAPAPRDKFPRPPFSSPQEVRDAAGALPVAASAPVTPVTQLVLHDGTQVGVRPIQPGDTEALTRFFVELSPKAYSTRFPTRAVNTEFDHREPLSAPVIAATLTSCELSQQKSLVALNANGAIIGLVDYSASLRMGSMIGLHAPRCEVNIVVADESGNTGLAPKLLQEGMTAAKADGFAQMVGYRQAGGATRKVVLDLDKPLRAQNRPARTSDYVPSPNGPFWPPEAWA
jgi:hypothetical protein